METVPFIYPASIIFLALVILVLIIYMNSRLRFYRYTNRAKEQTYADMELRLQKIEMEGIRQNLNPHLFKNILNSIQSHAFQTYFALDKLASVLDYILYESNRPYVSLKEEMEFVQNFIEINKLKMSPLFDVRVKMAIDGQDSLYNQKLIAPLVTVHMIENAFKHADLQSPDSFIAIVFEMKNNYFNMTVSNTISRKAPVKKEHSGVGFDNFIKRLEYVYKLNYSFDSDTNDNMYITHLKINLLGHKNQMLAAR